MAAVPATRRHRQTGSTMVTQSSGTASTSGGGRTEHHALVICDGVGRVLHAGGDLEPLLGLSRLEHHSQLAARVVPLEPGLEVPQTGVRSTMFVKPAGGGAPLVLASHPVQAQDASLTVFVLVDAPPPPHDPAIDRGIAAVLSHELRTPITTIYAGSQMLLRRSQLPDDQREMLADIQLEADRLYRLVEDLLVANVGQGGLQVAQEPILLQRTLPRVVALEEARWPHVRFVMTLASELPAVRADELYIDHVIRDLLANAGSFSGDGATVRLDARHAGDAVEVRVLDEGPGIDTQQAESLFRPFHGVEPDGGRPGPGLGLYVCKLLVEAMGGRVWARRRTSGGSELGFSLQPYAYEPDDGAD